MLLIEEISRNAMADAIYTIEQINLIGSRAIGLNEALNSGLINESRKRLLLEDLDKAMKDLQSSSQSGMDKIDKAIDYIDNFIELGQKIGKDNNIFTILDSSFSEAREIVAGFSAIKLGTVSSIKAFFDEGGKIAAIMDALAKEMGILSVYVKVLSAGFAQLIRMMRQIPDDFKESEAGKNKSVTLEEYLGSIPSADKDLDAKDFSKGVSTAMSDIKQKNKGLGFSLKGIKNFFKNNKTSMGIGALLGGVAVIASGGLALGPMAMMAAQVGVASAGAAGLAKQGLKRDATKPAAAYGTSIDKIVEAMMKTAVSDLEEGIPMFVQAVKGANPDEFTKAAEEAIKNIETINRGFNTGKVIDTYVKEYGSEESTKAFNKIRNIDSDWAESLIASTLTDEKALEKYRDTSVYGALTGMKKSLEESIFNDDDLILEAGELAHDYTMSELLFEKETRKQKKARQRKERKSNQAKSTPGKSKSGKKGAGATKPEYKKYKTQMKKKGVAQLSKAENKPESAEAYAKRVDDYEDKLNKKMVNKQRKTNITKIADEFEKKIMALEDEKSKAPEDAEDTSNTEKEESNTEEKKSSEESEASVSPGFEKASKEIADVLNDALKESYYKPNSLMVLLKEFQYTSARDILSPPDNPANWDRTDVRDLVSSDQIAALNAKQIEKETEKMAKEADEILKLVNQTMLDVEAKKLKDAGEKVYNKIDNLRDNDEITPGEAAKLKDNVATVLVNNIATVVEDTFEVSDAPPEAKEEKPSSGSSGFEFPDPAWSDALASDDPRLKDTQKKIIAILYGDKLPDEVRTKLKIPSEKTKPDSNKSSDSSDDSGGMGNTLLGLDESYDRRLLSLAGIK
tara:strand:- start:2717 stop:5278 length:2562 start_codon:yes stop_codon:yes gene_type:complete